MFLLIGRQGEKIGEGGVDLVAAKNVVSTTNNWMAPTARLVGRREGALGGEKAPTVPQLGPCSFPSHLVMRQQLTYAVGSDRIRGGIKTDHHTGVDTAIPFGLVGWIASGIWDTAN